MQTPLNFLALKYLSAMILIIFPTLVSAQSGTTPLKTHRIKSPFQAETTTLRVLLPDNYDPDSSYRVLYILPVVENANRRFGDGLFELLKDNFHNTHQLICVAPEFTDLPWYVNYPGDSTRQDERHFLETVIPFVDQNYSTLNDQQGRFLLGFSKSGWGVFSLLLRNPEMFQKAAGWDVGIRVDMGPIEEAERAQRIKQYFGGEANFEQYRISSLLRKNGKQLGDKARIFYYNCPGKRSMGGVSVHSLMTELEIPHKYLFEPKRKHRWDSGWIPQAIAFLMADE